MYAIFVFLKQKKMKNRTNVLKEKDIETLKKLYHDGKMDTEIAKILNVSDSCVFYWRKKLNLKSKFEYSKLSKVNKELFEKMFFEDKTDKEIGKAMNVSQSVIYSFRKKNNYKRRNFNESVKIKLSDIQKEILIGTVMGDMSLRKNKHVSAHCSHCIKQKDYCYAKYKEFVSLGAKFKYHIRKTEDFRTGIKYESYEVTIPANSELDKLYDLCYVNGQRRIPFELFEYFTARSLAYYFMDDGSKTGNGYMLASMRYKLDELAKFCKFLEDKFELKTNLWKDGKIYIRACSRKRFDEIVTPYIHESMKYKLHDVS